MVLNDKMRIAIARIMVDLINADGVINEKELSKFDQFRDEYSILPNHMIDAQKITFSQAVNLLKEHMNNLNDVERDSKRIKFIEQIEHLATSDGTVSTSEAIICLVMRYVLGSLDDSHSVFSCEQEFLRLSKRDVVYVECEENADINSEIRTYYGTLKNIYYAHGFEFIYIPQLCQDFDELTNEDLGRMILYLNPSLSKNEDVKEFLKINLITASTSDFTKSLLYKVRKERVSPSLLFKIKSSKVLDAKSGKFIRHTDFFQLQLVDGSLLLTSQQFLRKYISLVKQIDVNINHYIGEKIFNYKGFHKTLFDYLLKQDIQSIVISIPRDNHGNPSIVFGSYGHCSLSKKMELPLYILIIYLTQSGQGGLFGEAADAVMNNNRLEEQRELFYIIRDNIRKDVQYYKDNEFYSQLNVRYNKISSKIKERVNHPNIDIYKPKWDRTTLSCSIGFKTPVYVNVNDELIPLDLWIEQLSNK